MTTRPSVGWSMPVIMFSNVDFPLPDFPTIETNSPRLMVKSIPLRTVTSPAAFLKVLTMPCISMIASGVDISWLLGLARGLGEAGCGFISYLFQRFRICALYRFQFSIRDSQCPCEARCKSLVMRHHDDGLALVTDKMFKYFKNVIRSD